jgi:hypothetical protein
MADGSEVPSQGIWTGTFQWNKAKIRTSFEVFDSGGAWPMLIGKPLLEQLSAVHDYTNDTIIIPREPQPITIKNIHGSSAAQSPRKPEEVAPPCFLVLSIPADVLDSMAPHPPKSVEVAEQLVFSTKEGTSKERIEEYAAALSSIGAHVVISNRKPIISTVTDSSSKSPCSPVPFTADDLTHQHSTNVWPVFNHEQDDLGEIPDLSTSEEATPSITLDTRIPSTPKG